MLALLKIACAKVNKKMTLIRRRRNHHNLPVTLALSWGRLNICNLYQQTTAVEAMRGLFRGMENRAGNIEPGDVYPDRMAPIITLAGEGHILRMARWGLPSPSGYHSKNGIDQGVTNVRNTSSPHWQRWLSPGNRCLVPLERFAEPRSGKGAGNAWFELDENRPAFFAGIWVPNWRSIRKLKDCETTDDLFALGRRASKGCTGHSTCLL